MLDWIDTAIVALLALSIALGLWRGVLLELMAVLVWVLSLAIAILFSPMLAGYLSHAVKQPSAQVSFSFFGLFIVSFLVFSFVRHLFAQVLGGVSPGISGRLLGGVIGFIRGTLLVMVLVFLLSMTNVKQTDAWAQSHLLPTVTRLTGWMKEAMPDDAANVFQTIKPASDSPAQKITKATAAL